MKIKRNINGKEMEFELTSNEMYSAFYEQQNQFYKDDILSVLEEKGLMATDKQIAQMIEVYDDYLSDNDSWRYAVNEAIYVVMSETKQNN
jgi:hypothetical protein